MNDSTRGKSWQCPRCAKQVEEEFEVCWNCGTSREGVPDPDFQPAAPPAMDDDDSEDQEDLAAEEPKARKSYHPLRRFFQSAWTPFLAWLFAALTVVSLVVYVIYRPKFNEPFVHYPYIIHSINVILLIGCIGFIARRQWSYRWLQAGLLWKLILSWPYNVNLIYNVVNGLWFASFINRSYPPYVHILVRLFGLFLMLTFLITVLYQEKHTSQSSPDKQPEKRRLGYLVYAGLFLLLLSLVFRWMERVVERQIYAITIASYLEMTGAILILLWQLLQRDRWLPAAAIGLSVVLWIYHSMAISEVFTVLLWLPVIVLGIVSIIKYHQQRISWIAAILPVILMFIALFPYIPTNHSFGAYDKPTSVRPGDFPAYLQAPAGATEVTYMGGERPYLSFTIEEPYPAPQTLAFITEKLEAAGWEKLPYDALNPEYPSSHTEGWGQSKDYRNDVYTSYDWHAYWNHPEYGIVSVRLEYHALNDQPHNSLYAFIQVTSQKAYEQDQKLFDKVGVIYPTDTQN